MILPNLFCTIPRLYLTFQQACFLVSRPITRVEYLRFLKVSGCLGAKGSAYFSKSQVGAVHLTSAIGPRERHIIDKVSSPPASQGMAQYGGSQTDIRAVDLT